MSTPILSLENITYRYSGNNKDALTGLSLEINEGSVTAILGSNGAGKSTLLHLILGWLKPAEGKIQLQGRPLRSYSRREAGQIIALVPQTEHMPFDYSVLEYILLGRTPYLNPLETPGQKDLDVAFSALETAGLGELAHRHVTSLSGGERQLVLLARALTQQPKMILLDEPTAHLDLANKARLMEILRKLHKAGSTIIFSTHEPEAAIAVASDIILIRAGHILTCGPSDQVLTSENLTEAYGSSVRIVRVDGHRVALWS
jgi:iron complex transport system ATP-binding protein